MPCDILNLQNKRKSSVRSARFSACHSSCGRKRKRREKMKRNLKQILLVFLTLAFAVSASTCLFSCGREAVANTTGDVIPGIMASDSSTSGTVDATGGTTTGNVQPPQDVTTGTTSPIVTPPEDSGAYINPLTGLKTNNKDASKLPCNYTASGPFCKYPKQTIFGEIFR